MIKTWLTISALAVSLGGTSGGMAVKAYAAAASAPGYYQEGRWDEPPSEYRDVQRRGFHDGVEAARMDFDNHRHKDADDHEMFRHPPVDRAVRDDYRHAFREGYSRAMHHLREEHHD